MPRQPTSIASSFADIKADYAAMQDSRFRRRRQGVSSMGGSADVHSVSEARFIQMREYVRAMDRDDFLIGPLTDRCVENQVQGGYDLEVQTGDDELDKDLWQYFRAWRDDPALCDTAGVLSFPDMERLVARQETVDGDILAIPITDGGTARQFEKRATATALRSYPNFLLDIPAGGCRVWGANASRRKPSLRRAFFEIRIDRRSGLSAED